MSDPISVVLLCAAAFSLGCAAAWLVLGRRHARDLSALEGDMTAQVQTRYDAYLQLEARVKRLLAALDRLEQNFAREIANQTKHMRRLSVAIDRCEGNGEDGAGAQEDPLETLGLMEQEMLTAATNGAPPAADEQDEHEDVDMPKKTKSDLEAELAEWERRYETLNQSKIAELERQRSLVTDLTARMQKMEPLSKQIAQKDQELATLRTRVAALQEAAAAGPAPAAPAPAPAERAPGSFAGADSTLKELVEQLTASEGEVAEWHERYQEISRRRESALGSIQQEIQELGGLRDRCAQIERAKDAEIATWKGRVEELQKLFKQIEDLKAEIVATGESLGRARHEASSRAKENAELRTLWDGLTKQKRELDDRLTQQQQELETRTEQLRSLSARLEELEREVRSSRETVGGQKSKLAELMRNLESVQASAAQRDQHIKGAASLLIQLRPLVEALENELDAETPGK